MPAGDSETRHHTFKPKSLKHDVSVMATPPLGLGKYFQFLALDHISLQPRFPFVLRHFGLPVSFLKHKSEFEKCPRYHLMRAQKRITLPAWSQHFTFINRAEDLHSFQSHALTSHSCEQTQAPLYVKGSEFRSAHSDSCVNLRPRAGLDTLSLSHLVSAACGYLPRSLVSRPARYRS